MGFTGANLIIRACKPWNSVDAGERFTAATGEGQDRIDKCLECPYAECFNCYDSRAKENAQHRNFDPDALMELLLLKKKPEEILQQMNVSKRTIYNYRKKLEQENSKEEVI